MVGFHYVHIRARILVSSIRKRTASVARARLWSLQIAADATPIVFVFCFCFAAELVRYKYTELPFQPSRRCILAAFVCVCFLQAKLRQLRLLRDALQMMRRRASSFTWSGGVLRDSLQRSAVGRARACGTGSATSRNQARDGKCELVITTHARDFE